MGVALRHRRDSTSARCRRCAPGPVNAVRSAFLPLPFSSVLPRSEGPSCTWSILPVAPTSPPRMDSTGSVLVRQWTHGSSIPVRGCRGAIHRSPRPRAGRRSAGSAGLRIVCVDRGRDRTPRRSHRALERARRDGLAGPRRLLVARAARTAAGHAGGPNGVGARSGHRVFRFDEPGPSGRGGAPTGDPSARPDSRFMCKTPAAATGRRSRARRFHAGPRWRSNAR